MSPETPVQPPQKPRRSGTGWLVFLILLAVVLSGGNAYLYYLHQKQTQQVASLQDSLTVLHTRVDTLNALLAALDSQRSRLQAQLNTLHLENDSLRQALEDQLKKISYWRNRVYYWKRKYEELEKEVGGGSPEEQAVWKARYDSLLQEYQTLKARTEELMDQTRELEASIQHLTEENEKLKQELVRKILAYDVEVEGYRIIQEREVPTNKAKKVKRLRICFKLEENPAIKKESLDILFRIIDPNGVTLAMESAGSGKFTGADGKEYPYTFKTSVVYPPVSPRTCLYWDPFLTLTKGTYFVKLYHEGALIGSGSFYLR